MAYLCLLLSGAALLLNGLSTLGFLPRRDAAVFSLAIGSAQLVLGVAFLVMGSPDAAGPPASVHLTAAGMFLFGLTYVFVGLDVLLVLGGRGLGWFCGMVAFVGLLLAAAWLAADPLLAVLWLCWSVMWGLFFASMALGVARLDPFIGWSLVLTSQATATIPAFLGLAGIWPDQAEAAWLAAAVLAALFVLAQVLAGRGAATPHRAIAISTGEEARN